MALAFALIKQMLYFLFLFFMKYVCKNLDEEGFIEGEGGKEEEDERGMGIKKKSKGVTGRER